MNEIDWLPEPRKLVSELRTLGRERPLKVGSTASYVNYDQDADCVVRDPGCIAGVALFRMGHTIDQLLELDDYLDHYYKDHPDRESADWIVAVQLAHDAGKPYSQCVRDADRKIEYQTYEGDF